MAEWYVVQVKGGREAATVAALRQVAGEGVLEECFSPRWRTQRKVRGVWESVERLLLPGYVIAVTDFPASWTMRSGAFPDSQGFCATNRDSPPWTGTRSHGSAGMRWGPTA